MADANWALPLECHSGDSLVPTASMRRQCPKKVFSDQQLLGHVRMSALLLVYSSLRLFC